MYRVYHAIPVSGVAPEEQDIFLNERGGVHGVYVATRV